MRFLFDDKHEARESTEQNSFCFFENRACQCYPCHDMESINCLFCYCPLYHMEDCGGNFKYISGVKDCTDCTFPHHRESYALIIQRLAEQNDIKR